MLIFTIFGAVLLVYRLRGLAFERDVLRLQAEAAAAERLRATSSSAQILRSDARLESDRRMPSERRIRNQSSQIVEVAD